MYVLAAVLQVLYPEEVVSLFTAASILGPAFVLAGFLSVAAEAGQPLRGVNVLLNMKGSWMSRELLAGLSFVLLAMSDSIWPHPLLRFFAGAAALTLVVSQGFILLRARGVPAWNLPILPLLFLTSGCLTGVGILLAITPALGLKGEIAKHLGMIALGLVSLNLGVWLCYLRGPEVINVLKTWPMVGGVVGLGHLFPLILILIGLGFPSFWPLFIISSGVAILIGGVLLKDGLLMQAGHLIGIGVPLSVGSR